MLLGWAAPVGAMRSIRKCNVAVIGGAGFLGSHLVDHLINNRRCNVLVIDNLITGRKSFIHRDAHFEYADITESEHYLYQLFRGYKTDYVFNYAAEPYIPVSFARPLHVFGINAFGALKAMNAAQEAGVKGFLQVSSAEIYGGGTKEQTERWQETHKRMSRECRDTEETPYGLSEEEVVEGMRLNENSLVCPHSTYGASKAAIDAIVQVRWKEAKTPVIAMRQFNCVGERETHPYVIPEIISQIHENGPFDIRLGNNSTRDFLYAGDAVRMAVELLEKGQFGEVYNIGSQDAIKIYDLAERIGNLMNHSQVTVKPDPERVRPWEIWHLQSDNTKLYHVITTRPQISFDEALTRTINYFRESGHSWGF